MADKIVNGQSLDHGYLGMSSEPVTTGNPGAQISRIQKGSPAATAGLQVGDIVTGVDNTTVTSPGDLSAAIIEHSPGDQVTLHVQRDGQNQDITVTLGTRPATTPTTTSRRSAPH